MRPSNLAKSFPTRLVARIDVDAAENKRHLQIMKKIRNIVYGCDQASILVTLCHQWCPARALPRCALLLRLICLFLVVVHVSVP